MLSAVEAEHPSSLHNVSGRLRQAFTRHRARQATIRESAYRVVSLFSHGILAVLDTL